VFAELVTDLKTKVHTAAFAAVWGSVAAASLVSMFFFLCLGTFVWTSQHYDWVVASFVVGGFFLIAARVSSCAFIVVRRGYNHPPSPLPTAQRVQWWLDPAVLGMGLQLGRTIGVRRILPVLLVGALGTGWIMTRPTRTLN
jgi:hypothetical protein